MRETGSGIRRIDAALGLGAGAVTKAVPTENWHIIVVSCRGLKDGGYRRWY